MLHGEPPFDLSAGGDGEAVAVGPALRLIASGERPALGTEVPPGLRDLVHDMMSVDPAQRPASADVVVERLSGAGHGGPTAIALPRKRSRGVLVMVAAIALLAVVGLGVWLTLRSSSEVVNERVAAFAAPTEPAAPTAAAEPASAADEPATVDQPPEPDGQATPTAAPAPPVADVAAEENEDDQEQEPDATEFGSPSTEADSNAPTACASGSAWCDPLSLATWDLVGESDITTYREVSTEFGPGFSLTPGGGSEGGFAAQRSLSGVDTSEVVALRFRVRFQDLPAPSDPDRSWFQSIATVTDEQGRQWSVNMTNFVGLGLRFNAGFFVPEDISGGATSPISHAVDEWHCVELILNTDANPPVELAINGESMVELPDREAADHGTDFTLSLGPSWLEEPDLAPNITIADVSVGSARVGC